MLQYLLFRRQSMEVRAGIFVHIMRVM
jgi:hypothetical protein